MKATEQDRLILRVPPPGDISYVGYLYRMAQHNAYEPLNLMVNVVKQHFQQVDIATGNVFLPGEPAAINWLARFLWLEPLELYGLTPHRWARVLTPLGEAIETIELVGKRQPILQLKKIEKHHLHTHVGAQYCPACLREAAHHRRIWSLMAVTACTKHAQMLVRHCTKCGGTLSVLDLTTAVCSACGFDLRDATTLNLAQDEQGVLAQTIITAIIEQSEALPTLMVQNRLPETTARILYWLAHGLGRFVAQRPRSRYIHRIKGLDKAEVQQYPQLAETVARYRHLATVINALRDWSLAFQRLLDRMGGDTLNMMEDYRPLYELLEHDWQLSEMAFVQAAFNEMAAKRYALCSNVRKTRRYRETPAFAEKFEFLDYRGAGRILGLTAASVADMVRTGKIRGRKAVDSNHYLFDPDYVASLHRLWSQALTLQECAANLGITTKVVTDLIENGLLRAVRGPSVDGHAVWLINERHVAALYAGIDRRAHRRPTSQLVDHTIDLTRAAQILSVVGCNAAGVLARTLAGKLRAYVPEMWQPSLSTMRFSENEVRSTMEKIKGEQGWVDRAYIAERMGVKVIVVSRWVAHGLLQVVAGWGGAQYFDRDLTDAFIRSHVFSEEAAMMIGINLLALYKWAKLGRLHPVAGPDIDGSHRYLFARAEIERWQPGEWMTAPALARYYNISHTQLLEQVKAGKHQPISGPGIDGFKHYAFRTPSSKQHSDGMR